ncbi:hypothetical protein B0H34DRAFT_795372 [Crassisporium funariophilum]|nr:hypothetical protein B0H34DRAFT_795372 [Crassisporium funariophilum]
MHLTPLVALVSFIFSIPAVLAYPVGNSPSSSHPERDIPGFVQGIVLRSDEELYARSLLDIFKKKELTPEEKTIQQSRKANKAYHATGKEISKQAKADLGKDHKVEVTKFTCQGCSDPAAMRQKAEKKAQQEWKVNGNIQQYRKVDIHVVPEEGRHHIIAKYHNGGLAGPTFHFMKYDKGKK